MDCESRSPTLSKSFQAERKKLRFFLLYIILINIFALTIKL